MKINYHELKNDELNVKLKELKQELFNLRFSSATGQLSNPMEMVKCKKDIARVKTVLRERELGISIAGEMKHGKK